MLNKIMMKSHSEQFSQVERSAVIHQKKKKRKMKKTLKHTRDRLKEKESQIATDNVTVLMDKNLTFYQENTK